MDLLKYIKELLLLNDCVIIPEFGGFVTNYKSAGHKQSRFTPPQKTVTFNKKLNFNDGLFINYVARQEGIGYIQARKKVDTMVQELNYRLTDGEKINIPGIGDLRYDEFEHLIFNPHLQENINLNAYGLPVFHYESLFQKKHAGNIPTKSTTFNTSHVVFSQRLAKKVLIAVPVLLALALVPKKDSLTTQKSDLNPMSSITTVIENPKPIIVEEANIEVTEEIAPEVKKVETAVFHEEATSKVENKYHIIAGSFKNEKNASVFLQKLLDSGYDAQNIGVINGLNYISVNSFNNLEEAKAARDKYRQTYDGAGVWIYAKK